MKLIRKIILLIVLVFCGIISVEAQDSLTINGKILYSNGNPADNVTVGIEGAESFPEVTDSMGRFLLKATSGNVWLSIVPAEGYNVKRVYLDGRTYLEVYITQLNTVSGEEKIRYYSNEYLKKEMVGSLNTVDVDKIRVSPALSLDQYLQGRVSGLHVTNRSGFPGSGAVTLLHGVNSINADLRPLYVIDGMPVMNMGVFKSNIQGYQYNSLMIVNPLDISDITVLKDATYAANFGSMASNGIVMVSTLDPSVTSTAIDVDFRRGLSLAPNQYLPQLNAIQHKTLISEVLFSSGAEEELIQELYPALFLNKEDKRYINYQHNTNWQELIFSNAVLNNLNVKVKGGDEIARYGLSFGYLDAEGNNPNTGYEGYNLRFIGLLNVFPWLKMNAGVALNYSNSSVKQSAVVPEANPILASLAKSPMLYPFKYDINGEELKIISEVDELGISNPLAVINNQEAALTNFNSISSLGLVAEINENLNIQSKFGLNYNLLRESNFMPNRGMDLYEGGEVINISEAGNNSVNSLYFTNFMNYNKSINEKHQFSSLTGVNIFTNRYEYDWGRTRNSSANDEYRNLQDGTNSLWEIGGENIRWNKMTIYEHISYSYKDRYLASFSLSLDGSSRIGRDAIKTVKITGVPFGVFYAIGAGWRINSEEFLRNLSGIEELKLRISYGTTGNDDIGESTARKHYQVVKFRNTSGLIPAIMPNEQLGYERVSRLNGGIDFAVFGNRIIANIDLYRSIADDLLIYNPLKYYYGFDYRPENGGKMENRGVDLNLIIRVVDRPVFKWEFNAWASYNNNEIVTLKGDKLISDFLGGQIINQEGSPANSFYGYIYKGVYSSSQQAAEANIVNNKLIPYQAGDAIYEDLSGPDNIPDGIINDYDKTVIGNSNPDYYGGISNTFIYRRWSLATFFQYVVGNEIFNYVRYRNERMTGIENQSVKVLSRWQHEGQVTTIPRASFNDPTGNSDFSTRWMEDGSYFRFKTVTISYDIKQEFIGFRNAQLYLSASNILTLTNYLGFDPEFAHSYEHANQGIDYGQSPTPRQFMLGIKLGL